MTIKFNKAQRKQAKLRLALAGPSGSGKTYGALRIAKGMGGRIAVIDTERASASLYSGLVDFDTLDLEPPYTPERYIEAIRAAEQQGYDIILIDSATHEWDGSGGCLEINETLANAKYKGNTWSAWNETTPRHRSFLDAIIQSKCHIIATMRSKTETVQGENKKVVKLGMKAVQREGAEYEFTTVLDITHDGHYATTSKDRTGLFREPFVITEQTGKTLMGWLNGGAAEVPEQPRPQPEQQQPQPQPRPQQQPPAPPVGNPEALKEFMEALGGCQSQAEVDTVRASMNAPGVFTSFSKAEKDILKGELATTLDRISQAEAEQPPVNSDIPF